MPEQEKELPLTSLGRTADSPPEWTGTGDDPTASATASGQQTGVEDYYVLVCVPAGDVWSVLDEVRNLPSMEAWGNTSDEELRAPSSIQSTEEFWQKCPKELEESKERASGNTGWVLRETLTHVKLTDSTLSGSPHQSDGKTCYTDKFLMLQ